MIKRANTNGSFLFEMGDSTTSLEGLQDDLSNLESLVQGISGDFVTAPNSVIGLYSTQDLTASPQKLNSSQLTITCLYQTINYDVTDKVVYTPLTATSGGYSVMDGADSAIVVTVSTEGLISIKPTDTIKTYTANSIALKTGDTVASNVSMHWAGRTHVISVNFTVS